MHRAHDLAINDLVVAERDGHGPILDIRDPEQRMSSWSTKVPVVNTWREGLGAHFFPKDDKLT